MLSAKGFKSEVRTGLTLTVGADVEVNLTMAVGFGLGYSVWIDDDLPAHRAYTRVLEEQITAAATAYRTYWPPAISVAIEPWLDS